MRDIASLSSRSCSRLKLLWFRSRRVCEPSEATNGAKFFTSEENKYSEAIERQEKKATQLSAVTEAHEAHASVPDCCEDPALAGAPRLMYPLIVSARGQLVRASCTSLIISYNRYFIHIHWYIHILNPVLIIKGTFKHTI